MKFLCRVEEGQVTSFFETIDYIKGQLMKANDKTTIQTYQALLDQYQMNLDNIVIERG